MNTIPVTSALLVALACLGPLRAYKIQDDMGPLALEEDLNIPLPIGGSRRTRSAEDESVPEFGYERDNGPRTWPRRFPTCAGRRQSPIDIDLDEAGDASSSEESNRLRYRNYDVLPRDLELTNCGHSVVMTGNWTRTPRISGFILSDDYLVGEVAFHWGRNSRDGSEHLVNGDRYALEMHVVHFKKEYGTIDKAKKKEDGLAVLAYFFKVQRARNHDLQRLLDKIDDVITPGVSVPITPFRLDELAPPFHKNFASYFGSLTAPRCNQVVRWIVNLEPLSVSLEQLSQFRRVKNEEGSRLVSNIRPPQQLNNRRVILVP